MVAGSGGGRSGGGGAGKERWQGGRRGEIPKGPRREAPKGPRKSDDRRGGTGGRRDDRGGGSRRDERGGGTDRRPSGGRPGAPRGDRPSFGRGGRPSASDERGPSRGAPRDGGDARAAKPARAAPGPWMPGVGSKDRYKKGTGGARSGGGGAGGDRVFRPTPRSNEDVPKVDHEVLVYGLHSVVALLAADPRRVQCLFVDQARVKQPDITKLLDDAQNAGVRVQKISTDTMGAMARGAVHQGVAVQVVPFRYSELRDLLHVEPPMLLVLDEVQDPQNVGAAARAAWALGGTGLVISKDRSASVTAAAEKVASGAFAHLPVAQVANLSRALEDLKKAGVWIIGLDVEGDADLWDQDFTVPVALVVGGEQSGMRRLTREHCDAVVKIPMAHPAAALNAADAAAVALYEAARQRAGSAGSDDGEEE